jgi:HSP20 family molecular chaperone IbpA
MTRYDSRSWIWAEALALLRNAERWQQRVVALDSASGFPCWEPAIDLYEQGGELTIFVALPGVAAGQLEVIVEPAQLVVRGTCPIPPAFKRAAIHRLEIPYGMTGEISLRGLVLPVGGIKEKVLAAMRAGISRVMLPARNRRDLDDVPAEAKQKLEFVFIENVDDAIAQAMEPVSAELLGASAQANRTRPLCVELPEAGPGKPLGISTRVD